MKVTTVTATLRYSAEAKGAWRSIEVGAEATLTASDETWETAQAELYHRLGQQLKTLWNNGKANGQETPPAETPPTSTGPSKGSGQRSGQAAPREPRQAEGVPHWCSEHNQEFKARTGQYGEFYSHQIKGTRQWCNESKK